VKFFKPAANPKAVGVSLDSLWLTRKIQIVKSVTGTTSATIVGADVISALGLTKADFYIEQVAAWNMAPSGTTNLRITAGTGDLVNGVSVIKDDWGAFDSPASVGINVPRAIAKQFPGVSATSLPLNVLSVSQPVAVISDAVNIVVHLWVVYRPSA